MTNATQQQASPLLNSLRAQLPPLGQVTRPNLKTEEAAFYLNRRPQTLRSWACLENGPIRPRRIGGLLAWNTSEVKARDKPGRVARPVVTSYGMTMATALS